MKTKIKAQLKTTVQWMRDHPLKACGFTFAFTILPAIIAIVSAAEDWPFVRVFVAIYALTFALFWFVHWRDVKKKTITALLVLGIFMTGVPTRAEDPPPQDPKPTGYVIIGVVVIVVGAITYVLLRRLCQRVFNRPPPPPNTNAEPFQVSGQLAPAALDGSFAATRTYYFLGSCEGGIAAASAPEAPIAMELTGSFIQTTNGLEFRLAPRKLDAAEDLVGPLEFEQLIAQHGVRTGNGIDQQFFGRNGRPSTQGEVPIYFSTDDNGRGSFSVGRTGELQAVVMERSPDLKRWEELTTARISAGQQLRFLDATAASQMFYRFRPL